MVRPGDRIVLSLKPFIATHSVFILMLRMVFFLAVVAQATTSLLRLGLEVSFGMWALSASS